MSSVAYSRRQSESRHPGEGEGSPHARLTEETAPRQRAHNFQAGEGTPGDVAPPRTAPVSRRKENRISRDTGPAMSQENVELVQRAVAAWNGRDIDAMLALTDPEVEYVNSPTAVEPGTRSGHESLKDVLRTQWEILSDGHWEVDRLHERGGEIVGLGRISRRMPGSEARIEDRILVTVRFDKGKVTRMEVLGFGQAEVQSALEAVGLSK